MTHKNAQQETQRRAGRTRHKLKTAAIKSGRKRLSVFRSNSHIYAQLIDDTSGQTLVSASSVDKALAKSLKTGASIDTATKVGEELAKRAQKAGVTDIYFDRGGFRYQGRVKALAEGARAGGLKF